ncbi:MAG: MBL fold metallo-hydrolase RNA specificity domain-containing protein [Promethearchaeota archaeon]
MTTITIYDGAETIGGTKIYLKEKGNGLFLDFGMNFKKYGEYFQEFLKERPTRGIHDLIQLNLIPRLNIYRKDLIPSDLNISSFPSLKVDGILLSHAHMDHFGNISLLDHNIPIIASPISIVLLKSIIDSSKASLSNEVAYFFEKIPADDDRVLKSGSKLGICRKFYSTQSYSESMEDFLSSCVKRYRDFGKGELYHLDKFLTPFEIKAFEVDHSIYGAVGFIINRDNSIAYTGDFRLHGKMANKSKDFIRSARDASVLIIEGTRTTREDINESEDIVFENCLDAVETSKDLVVADFSARNFERLETFREIAHKVRRSLVVTAKDAYLLKALEKADGIDRLKDIVIYQELKVRSPNWEEIYLKNDENVNYLGPLDISKESNRYILCFSLFNLKSLLDIKPTNGTYIYSSSEAFEEETEFDFIRLSKWLGHFGFKIYGFEIIEEEGRLKPIFSRGFHASGHASQNDLRWAIETIDPDIIIPVHTDNPQWFKENFDNTFLVKDGETIVK